MFHKLVSSLNLENATQAALYSLLGSLAINGAQIIETHNLEKFEEIIVSAVIAGIAVLHKSLGAAINASKAKKDTVDSE